MIKIKEKNIENADWMDSADVFEYLKISKRTLQNWRDTGVIPYYFVKGKVWYKKSEIDALLEASRVQKFSAKRLNRACLASKN